MRLLILTIFLLSAYYTQAEELDLDCLSQVPPELNLPVLNEPVARDEFRIYECVMFGLDVSLSRIIRLFPHSEFNEFNMPFYQSSREIDGVKVKEYSITSGFGSVFRFKEWTADYQSKVSDGAWYELEYNWNGEHGKSIFDNPHHGADIDAQMLARLLELTR
jgi:hypothetical protein